jgi:biotin carboxylase
MSKRYVLVFAKTPYHKTPYDKWLEGTDIEPIILTTDGFIKGYKHIEWVYSFSNYDTNQFIEKKALALGEKYPFIAIFARAEADIIRASKLRSLLNIPGQSIESALAYRNKIVMKDHLADSDMLLPKYKEVHSGYDIVKFVDDNGYPVVLKPLTASGSFNTFIIKNETELDKYLENPPQVEMEIETYVNGKMYHVDGLILDGELKFVQPFEYINDCLSFREDKYVGNVTVDPDNPVSQALIAAAKAVIAKLPQTKHMAFHAEFWHTEYDEFYFCEIASRTGGGMISTTLRRSIGLDLDKEWFYAECHVKRGFTEQQYVPCGCVCIPPVSGVFRKSPDYLQNPLIACEELSGKINERYYGGVKSGLFLVGYVLNGDSAQQITNNIHAAAQWFAENSEWERLS